MTNPDLVQKIRNLFKGGKNFCDIVRFLEKEGVVDSGGILITLMYFRAAFNLPLKDVSQIGAWKFFKDGYLDDDEVMEMMADCKDKVTNQINSGLET